MNRKYLNFFLFITFLLSNVVFAQELYICESYTENGTPVGPFNRLEIKPYGTAVYVLLDNKQIFKDQTMYLFIDKLVDKKFTPYDSKTITVNNNSTWAVTSFEFKEQGIYELYFLNSSQSKLATSKLETYFKGHSSNKVVSPAGNKILNSKFVFCELVVNGKPVNSFNSLSLSASEGEAFIYLNNNLPFGYDMLKVQYWKRSTTNESYEELIESKKYKILPEWKDAFFKYQFKQTGQFKVDIFDKNDNFVTSNVITITN